MSLMRNAGVLLLAAGAESAGWAGVAAISREPCAIAAGNEASRPDSATIVRIQERYEAQRI
jgi:hypothetical protein